MSCHTLQVCSALGHIAKHSADLAEVVVEAEVFPKCLTCLKYPDEFVQKCAATLVSGSCGLQGSCSGHEHVLHCMTCLVLIVCNCTLSVAPHESTPVLMLRTKMCWHCLNRCGRWSSTHQSLHSWWCQMVAWAPWWSTATKAQATTGEVWA